MEHIRIALMRTRVSLAVCLLDSFTLDSPLGIGTLVLLEDTLHKPIVKANGYYIFTDLQERAYRLHIKSQHYFSEYVDIQVGAKDQLVYVSLLPRPSYPFQDKDTLLRVGIKGEDERPYPNVSVSAAVVTEEGARARLAQDEAAAGADELTLGSVTGKLGVGDRFLLRSRNGKDEELCRIDAVMEYQRKVKLERPLTGAFTRGSLLLPVVHTRSDERGEAVLAFANCRAKQFNVKLELTHGEHRLLKEVNLTEGGTTLAGSLCL
jgi:hypothetical protein